MRIETQKNFAWALAGFLLGFFVGAIDVAYRTLPP